MSAKGNKSFLPSKPCAHCGRPMVWRKKWARNWEEVKFCSEKCRRQFKGLRVPLCNNIPGGGRLTEGD
ncbi:MAG: DUF2256 domain-containing protein [Bacteroidota bacterium]|nr:DUF2256 domain-containing protein [Bacteroidota bacterium]